MVPITDIRCHEDRYCRMRSLPKAPTHDQCRELNPRALDLWSSALPTRSRDPTHIVGNTALNRFYGKRVRTLSAVSLIELDYPTNKIVAEYYCVSFTYFCKYLIKWTRSLWSALHLFAQASGIRFYKYLFSHLPLLHDDRTCYWNDEPYA